MSRVRLAVLAALAGAALAVGCGGDRQPNSLQGAEVDSPTTTTATITPATTATVPPPAPPKPEGPLGARLKHKVALRARPDGKIVADLAAKTRWGSPRVLAVTEQRDGWLGVLSEHMPGKVGWIPKDAVELLLEPWSLRIDLSARSITVSHEGKVVRRVKAAIGAPGSPTPTGRFGVTDTLRLTGGGPYGCCAIAITARQRNIPQGWTGGDRVAIHGTTSPSSIGRAVSHGCLRAAEPDLRWMLARIPLGTHVDIVA
ncbi:MAG: L,D-transpeptidase [Solirubrobacterales bacterium]